MILIANDCATDVVEDYVLATNHEKPMSIEKYIKSLDLS